MMSSVAVLLVLVVSSQGIGPSSAQRFKRQTNILPSWTFTQKDAGVEQISDTVPPWLAQDKQSGSEVKERECYTKPECLTDEDCVADRACSSQRCQNPCNNACGINTSCRVVRHIPVCSCVQGYIGDPMLGCVSPACTPGVNVTNTGRKKYDISTFKLNWFEAFMSCQARGLRLATIENKEQDDDLVAEMKRSKLPENIIWIGATDLNMEGNWYWMTTGQPMLKYRNWIDGEPNNVGEGGQHCLESWEGKQSFGWGDDRCTIPRLFACEYY